MGKYGKAMALETVTQAAKCVEQKSQFTEGKRTLVAFGSSYVCFEPI